MARAYKQGFFKPINPKKYVGNPRQIVYRSSWELKAMSQFDLNPDVVSWASEELVVPYFDPVQGRNRRYFPDFLVKMKDGTVYMVEIKPAKEMVPPKPGRKVTKRFIAESATYETNQAKWEAAREFCTKRKWKFMVLNEFNLGIKRR
jgi:hypothetical protein